MDAAGWWRFVHPALPRPILHPPARAAAPRNECLPYGIAQNSPARRSSSGGSPSRTAARRVREGLPPEELLLGREPFTYGRAPRYFGTGVPFYQSGPGFTGGYYGYGDEPPQIPTELEREY